MNPEIPPPAHIPASDVLAGELERRLFDPGLTLVDVLPRDSFESGHIPGAVSLPVGEIESRARQVLPDRSREIVVYCGGPT